MSIAFNTSDPQHDIPCDVLDFLASGLEMEDENQNGESKITDHDEKSNLSNKSTVRKYSEISKEESDRQTFWEVLDSSVHSTNHTVKQQRGSSDILPKHIAQDIRAAYSQMFINSLNSGDINQIQNFFRAFMAGPCQFSIQHKISKQYGIPRYLNATGPDLFAHYAMGVFVSFPDLVVKLKNSYTIMSKEWKGSRIIMETEFLGSKLRNLPDYPWIPRVDQLANIYKEVPATLAGTLPGFKLPQLTKIPGAATTIASAVGPVEGGTTAIAMKKTPIATASVAATGAAIGGLACINTEECSVTSTNTNISAITTDAESISSKNTSTPPTSPLSVIDTPSTTATAGSSQYDRPYLTSLPPQQQLQQQNATSKQADQNRHGPVVFPESRAAAPPAIPLSFVDRLINHAQVVVKPEKLHMRGCITLYLDENNCMKHMVCAQSSVF